MEKINAIQQSNQKSSDTFKDYQDPLSQRLIAEAKAEGQTDEQILDFLKAFV